MTGVIRAIAFALLFLAAGYRATTAFAASAASAPATPIRHIVVLFQENVPFDLEAQACPKSVIEVLGL